LDALGVRPCILGSSHSLVPGLLYLRHDSFSQSPTGDCLKLEQRREEDWSSRGRNLDVPGDPRHCRQRSHPVLSGLKPDTLTAISVQQDTSDDAGPDPVPIYQVAIGVDLTVFRIEDGDAV